MHEGQINTKPITHLTHIDNSFTDKASIEDKLKSNAQIPLK